VTLIGGTAYGLDSIAGALVDYAKGQTSSIYRDTDPVPVGVNGPGTADNSQYWMVGGLYDPLRNSDSLVAANGGLKSSAVLDGGAGNDSMVGGLGTDTLCVSSALGNQKNKGIRTGDIVVGGGVTADNNGKSVGDWIVYTGSDVYWSGQNVAYRTSYNQDNDTFTISTLVGSATTSTLGYALSRSGDAAGGQSISNIKLQDGSPVARWAVGNATSTGNQRSGIPVAYSLGAETGSRSHRRQRIRQHPQRRRCGRNEWLGCWGGYPDRRRPEPTGLLSEPTTAIQAPTRNRR